MAKTTPMSPKSKDARELRLLTQYFPNADKLVFDKTKKAYVPLPILMRKAMRYLSAVELRVLIYLQTRCSQRGFCFPTLDEIAHDLNLSGLKNLVPHIKKLEKKKFISTAIGGGRKYFLVHDPAVAIAHMVEDGTIPMSELFEINDLLEILGRDQITAVPKGGTKVTHIDQAKQA